MAARNRACSGDLIFYTFLLLCLFPSKHCFSIYNITQYQSLSHGQTLVSPSRIFELGFFSPKNSSNKYVGVWYRGVSPQTVVWVANRESPLRNADSHASLTIGVDGNLELLDGKNDSVWSTDIVNVPSNSSLAILQDDGNFLLNDSRSGEQLWQSFDHLADTFLPGSLLGFDIRTNVSYAVTCWKSESDPSPGSFVAGISRQRPPQAFVWINGTNSSTPHWRSGPWGKSKFTGIHNMNTLYGRPFELFEDAGKGTTRLYFNKFKNSIVENLYLSPQGTIKTIQKDEHGRLYAHWEAPKGRCDLYGYCGPFSVCKEFKSPVCKCLKGFVPKLSEEWSNGKWTKGCVRRIELLCKRNTTSPSERGGFWKIGNVKVPNSYIFVETDYYNSDNCKTMCLGDCSCLAYAFVETIGCLLWSESLIDIQGFLFGGEDLFVRLAHEELGRGERRKIVIVIVAILSGAIIIGSAVCGLRIWKAKQQRNIKKITEKFDLGQANGGEQHDPVELPSFELGTILVATDHFSQINKLGQGGFGSVYKGKLQDGREIAVKRLSSSSGQGVQEFKNEMILISKLQHRNLVRLLGYCTEEEEKLLVYEFMPNKSLDAFIFNSRTSAQLNWATRLNIIQGVARGLVYLHRDSCLRVIHRDLKASNILLDENMNPKISDFGLAKMFQGTLDLANASRVVGTLGYMSPEYAMGGICSEKLDVFSFGVLILEIVTGKKNTNFHDCDQHISLISYAWQLWSENREIELVDETLADSYCAPEAKRCIHVGLLCAQDHAADRPTMSAVVSMLSDERNCPKPKQPMFIRQSSPRGDFHLQSDGKFSVNEATISLIEGR